MATAFYGLHIAKSGLYASQKGLEIVGNNVANANTVGYTRQRLNLSSISAPNGNGKLATLASATVGGGVSIDNIEQCRDKYLDIQFRRENSLLGEWSVKSDALYYIEDLFNVTNESGIDKTLGRLFDTLEELSKSPESEEIRSLVRQNAIVFTETMNYYSSQLEKLQNQQNHAIEVTVGELNSLVSLINDLNTQIQKYERNGDNANELRDKRNVALDSLSGIIDITYHENDKGVVTVCFGSNDECLVDGTGTYLLTVNKDLPDYYGNANMLYSISTASGDPLSVDDLNGGKLKGYLDMRDGDSNLNMGLPYFLEKLDNLAKGIVETFNSIHQNGYTYPSGNVSTTGINFFDPGSVTAKTISLDSAILDSVFNIAAIKVDTGVIVDDSQKGNNKNLLELLKILDKTDIAVISNIEQYLKSIVSDVAVQTSYSNGRVDSQSVLVNNILYKREAVSGVSTDEEMTSMIMFQKSYSAAARLITAFDEQLDTLVNKMGLVGR